METENTIKTTSIVDEDLNLELWVKSQRNPPLSHTKDLFPLNDLPYYFLDHFFFILLHKVYTTSVCTAVLVHSFRRRWAYKKVGWTDK